MLAWFVHDACGRLSCSYRLLTFGFMALDELYAEANTTGNYGVQDQTVCAADGVCCRQCALSSVVDSVQ